MGGKKDNYPITTQYFPYIDVASVTTVITREGTQSPAVEISLGPLDNLSCQQASCANLIYLRYDTFILITKVHYLWLKF